MKNNNQKITPEFCKNKVLYFSPKTEEEAIFIQQKLFEMGYRWRDSGQSLKPTKGALEKGIYLQDGILLLYTDSPSLTLLCTSAQFEEKYMSFEERVFEQFSNLSAEIKAVAKEVAEIKAQLQPQKLDKPSLKNKGPEQP